MECEGWNVECGGRNVECGEWSVKSGEWRVESEEWSLECGVWSVECGLLLGQRLCQLCLVLVGVSPCIPGLKDCQILFIKKLQSRILHLS